MKSHLTLGLNVQLDRISFYNLLITKISQIYTPKSTNLILRTKGLLSQRGYITNPRTSNAPKNTWKIER